MFSYGASEVRMEILFRAKLKNMQTKVDKIRLKFSNVNAGLVQQAVCSGKQRRQHFDFCSRQFSLTAVFVLKRAYWTVRGEDKSPRAFNEVKNEKR